MEVVSDLGNQKGTLPAILVWNIKLPRKHCRHSRCRSIRKVGRPDSQLSGTTWAANRDFEGGREKFASRASEKNVCTPVLTGREPELSMRWVDPWVGLGWVRLGWDFSVFGGLGWVHYSKSTKIWKDYVNAFEARLDEIWLHQAAKFVSCIGLGRVGSIFFHLLWVGLGCVNQLMGWVGSGHTKWTHGRLCDKPVETVFSQTLTMLSRHLVKFVTAKATLVLLLFHVRWQHNWGMVHGNFVLTKKKQND